MGSGPAFRSNQSTPVNALACAPARDTTRRTERTCSGHDGHTCGSFRCRTPQATQVANSQPFLINE